MKQFNSDIEFWTNIQATNVKNSSLMQTAIDNLENSLNIITNKQLDNTTQLQELLQRNVNTTNEIQREIPELKKTKDKL